MSEKPETAAAAPAERSRAGGGRPLRADARRKRDAILAAAVDVFLERGVDVALDDVAKAAGVGIATLYRNFPTREALITGAYLREVDNLCDGVDALLSELPADEALISWMQRFIGYTAGRPGMSVALKSIVFATDSSAGSTSHERIYGALRQLVAAGEESGVIRGGVVADDLAGALSGFSLITGQPGSQERANRLVTLLVDGLRYGAPNHP